MLALSILHRMGNQHSCMGLHIIQRSDALDVVVRTCCLPIDDCTQEFIDLLGSL
jgi:hypothetical protein